MPLAGRSGRWGTAVPAGPAEGADPPTHTHVAVAEHLGSRGAEATAEASGGVTPFLIAKKWGHLLFQKYLVKLERSRALH